MWIRPARAHHRRADDWHRTDGGVWLPGAGDVPRAADVPMRGAGMVRRGMGFGFGPAGCCCEADFVDCTQCANLDYEYDVTISGFEDTITSTVGCGDTTVTGCESLNGTFRVAWLYELAPFDVGICDGAFGNGCTWVAPAGTISTDRETCSDLAGTAGIYLSVRSSGPGLIDVQVYVATASVTHYYYVKTGVECKANCLDGLVVPACGKSDLSYPYGPVSACVNGEFTGSALIDTAA